MLLSAWKAVDRDIRFDPDTGHARVVRRERPREPSDPVAGFAAFERALLGPRRVFAVYRWQDALFFNAGKARWELGWDGPSFEHGRSVRLPIPGDAGGRAG